MLTPLHDDRRYLCPGDPVPISRSVHLARMAASFVKCRTCPQADVGPCVAGPIVPLSERTVLAMSLERKAHGFRGRAGEPLDRRVAMTWAGALASALWDEAMIWEWTDSKKPEPQSAVLSQLARSERRSPRLVIGYDERPGSPDVLTGVARGLELMSCHVDDVGLSTEPCLRSAIQHLQADAGVFVTGSDCDPSWIGFDVFRELGLPPEPAFLDRWEAAAQTTVTRPSRSPGSLRAVSLADRYDAELASHFHALRPLTVVCGATSRQVLSRLERLFARLPGRIRLETLPIRRRSFEDPQDADALRMGAAVREHGAHLGIILGEDGSACGFLDERGSLVSAHALAAQLIPHVLNDEPEATVVLATDVWDQLAPVVTSAGGRPVLVSAADRAARLMAARGAAAFGADHRTWFGGGFPVCDAIVTLAKVLQLLSRSDAEFSQVVADA